MNTDNIQTITEEEIEQVYTEHEKDTNLICHIADRLLNPNTEQPNYGFVLITCPFVYDKQKAETSIAVAGNIPVEARENLIQAAIANEVPKSSPSIENVAWVYGEVDSPYPPVRIVARDKNPGGGYCHYEATIYDKEDNTVHRLEIDFQGGPLSADNREHPFFNHEVNGTIDEVLLQILLHRQKCFMAGPFADEFAVPALQGMHKALKAKEDRKAARQARGVLGQHTK